jgi:hypothetical protein
VARVGTSGYDEESRCIRLGDAADSAQPTSTSDGESPVGVTVGSCAAQEHAVIANNGDVRNVESIKKDVGWLGFKWDIEAVPPLTVS